MIPLRAQGTPKMSFVRMALLGSVTALTLAGCVTPQPPAARDPSAVNPDYKAGRLEIPVSNVPTLEEVVNKAPSQDKVVKEGEDKLRGGAIKDAALSYGARAGLAWESRVINRMLQERSADLARTYDFQRAMIKGPDNVTILPPVISEARQAWETSEAGKTLRVADTVYEIVEQARFTAVPPLWQAYLVRDYKTPEPPPDSLLPKDSTEREQWRKWVSEGWAMGQKQAREIFQADLERLERDFNGMVRYKALLEQGKVSAPIVADARFGTTGTGQDMRVNDRAIRITRDPTLQVGNPQNWQSAPTTPGPNGTTTGNAPATPNAKADGKETRPAPPPRRASSSRRAWDGPAKPAAPVTKPAPAAPSTPAKPASAETF